MSNAKPSDFAIAILSLAIGLGLGSFRNIQAEEPKPIRALLITGGCCHDYDVQKNLIRKGLEARAHIEVTVVQQGGSATNSRIPLYEDPNWAEGFDIVLHDECFADVDDPAWTARVLEPHRRGVPAVVIHCAMHCYRDGTDQWFEFCGVTSRTHGAHYPHEVLNRDAEHPIMADFGAGWANPAGELYWIEKVWPTAHPLAAARNREKGNEEVCVWTNDYRGTRVFGTTLGHHNETVESDAFLDLLTRGTLWACNKLDDQYLKVPAPETRPVDLAKGKAAKASSEETSKGNVAGLAVDDKLETRWCASGGDAPQWLSVDLGESRDVRGCTIRWEFDERIYRHYVEVSTDGEQWERVADAATEAAAREAMSGAAVGSVHAFQRDDIRWVRVTFLGGEPGCWGSIRELRVHGTETETIDPQAQVEVDEARYLSEVKVPEGFRATLFAAPPAVAYPVFVATEPDGTTYVSVDRNGSLDREPRRGSIYRLRDVDGDGRADESKLFVSDVDSPRGLVWMRDRLIVLHPPHLTAFIDADHDGISESSQRLVSNIAFGFADRPADHTSNGVTLGIDGWLYLAIGDFGFMQATGADGTKLQFRGGGVVRVRPDGTEMHLSSRGTRNILEVGLAPTLDGFARDNTNDGGGWDIRLHHFGGLDDHGYPTRYLNFQDEILAPLADYGGGSGCGACYVSESAIPGAWGEALYTADWGRDAIYRHRVTPRGATYEADQEEFMRLPRATDLDVDAAGRIVAASWRGATFTYAGDEVGFLVRVEPRVRTKVTVPDFEMASEEQLLELLGAPSHRLRLAAQCELLSRGLSESAEITLLERVQNETRQRDVRIAALFTLALGGRQQAKQQVWERGLRSDLAPWVVRAWSEQKFEQFKGEESLPWSELAKSSDARLQAELIRAIVKTEAAEQAPVLAHLLLFGTDHVVRHTAANGLIELRAWKTCLDVWDSRHPDAAEALGVVSRMSDAAAVDACLERLDGETDKARQTELFRALSRMRLREGEWNGVSWGTRPDTRGPVYQPEPWEVTERIDEALVRALADGSQSVAAERIAQLRRHRAEGEPFTSVLAQRATQDPAFLSHLLDWLEGEASISPEAHEMLAALVTSEEAEPRLRSRALRVLWKMGTDRVAPLLAAWRRLETEDRELAAEVFRLMRQPEGVARHAAGLVSALEEATDSSLTIALLTAIDAPAGGGPASPEVIVALQRSWERAAGPRDWMEALRLADDRRWEDRIWQAIASEDAETAAAAASLVESWKLQPLVRGTGPTIRELGPQRTLNELGAVGAATERGARWFARLNCANCHTIREGETPRGPHLPNVVKTYDRQKLAEAILFPSRSLAQGFVTETFETLDGGSLTGFVVREEAERIAVRDAQGREHLLELGDIGTRERGELSVMPEGLVDELTREDLEALLDYLQSLR